MITRVFDKGDITDLYSTWHLEEGGIVSIVVVEHNLEIRMTLAMAEELGLQISRQAEYGRYAARRLNEGNRSN
jgi:hypothetical protein